MIINYIGRQLLTVTEIKYEFSKGLTIKFYLLNIFLVSKGIGYFQGRFVIYFTIAQVHLLHVLIIKHFKKGVVGFWLIVLTKPVIVDAHP